jgi:hypothetical protein
MFVRQFYNDVATILAQFKEGCKAWVLQRRMDVEYVVPVPLITAVVTEQCVLTQMADGKSQFNECGITGACHAFPRC